GTNVRTSPSVNRFYSEESLEELKLLSETAGAEVLDAVIQERQKPDPALFVGKGKTDQIADLSRRKGANIVIFDHDLSPAQVYNLEKRLDIKVIDRSTLILDIFAKRAKTKESKIQVELAQLKYLLPRLTRGWTHLSRQWGGIGTKGPGETQLEMDRRRVRKKILDLEKSLVKIDKERTVQRKRRKDMFSDGSICGGKVTLVGYTNAGKSTLFNQLTKASIKTEEKLFTTLDSTTRLIRFAKEGKHLGDFKIVLTDTIGFIRKLPHHLVASFKSTLDEVRLADLLLHVVDVSHPDFAQHIDKVNQVLSELDSLDKPTIMVYNKIDRLNQIVPTPPGSTMNENYIPGTPLYFSNSDQKENKIFISAQEEIGINDLIGRIKEYIKRLLLQSRPEEKLSEALLFLDNSHLDLLTSFYKIGVVTESKFEGNRIRLKIKGKKKDLEKIRKLNGRVELKLI
ncbi:MAG: GTPase HflX, partial [candidate division Zixibacteria bacterium]|nr:GTPase HflX [candidate division Zixibacteria bacterium]